MDVQIGGSRVGEQALDSGHEVAPVDQVPRDHHRGGIERADCERARAQLFRDLIDRIVGL